LITIASIDFILFAKCAKWSFSLLKLRVCNMPLSSGSKGTTIRHRQWDCWISSAGLFVGYYDKAQFCHRPFLFMFAGGSGKAGAVGGCDSL
jgi:hypothetical protein